MRDERLFLPGACVHAGECLRVCGSRACGEVLAMRRDTLPSEVFVNSEALNVRRKVR